MGQLYYRQEKYDVALVHFKGAALVNPRSSVLRCYWGMALAKQNILGNALNKLQVRVLCCVFFCCVCVCVVLRVMVESERSPVPTVSLKGTCALTPYSCTHSPVLTYNSLYRKPWT